MWGPPVGGPEMPAGQGQTQLGLYFGSREQGSSSPSARALTDVVTRSQLARRRQGVQLYRDVDRTSLVPSELLV